MVSLAAILHSHPAGPTAKAEGLTETITALTECAQICGVCADACLAEPDAADLAACVRRDLDCADICATAARMLARDPSDDAYALLEVVAQVCRRCADECARHAGHHEHCRICAEACRTAERACWTFIAARFRDEAEGIPAGELADDDLLRQLAQMHRTRHDTLLHAAQTAVERHLTRTAELETEYLRRFPEREVDARRTRAGARAS